MIENIQYHIVFGDSAAGSLRYYLGQLKKLNSSMVITIRDDFSVGPLLNYDTVEGENDRMNWWSEIVGACHVVGDKSYWRYLLSFKKLLEVIKRDDRVLLWYGTNSFDLVGVSYLASLLRNNGDNIFGVNVSKEENAIIDSLGYIPYSVAQIPPELFDRFIPSIVPIDIDQWSNFKRSWKHLLKEDKMTRVIENGSLHAYGEDYYDPLILSLAPTDFVVAARVVGEVLGRSSQMVSDLYIDWRIRQLLKAGKLKSKGPLISMRDFSIKRIDRD